ncbi:hypothetical protein WJX72_003093 [[Myrmecia] bisecta]|uniref:Uncharacterized protein n=1 Tax=[Myrmecia] bisecta TaxID=41462 RepID=A0AAW1Q2T1_9CHLO
MPAADTTLCCTCRGRLYVSGLYTLAPSTAGAHCKRPQVGVRLRASMSRTGTHGTPGEVTQDVAQEPAVPAGHPGILDPAAQQFPGQFASQASGTVLHYSAELQTQLTEASEEHNKSKEWLKQVDAARGLAREAYRADQNNAEKHKAWKKHVGKLKEAQDHVRATKEAFYRSAASVDVVGKELKRRAMETLLRDMPPLERMAKRKRSTAPDEPCPYCGHDYTVRDGLSSKADSLGTRLHLRKCQCREKTPPCRNCPKCRGNLEIMAMQDATQQLQLCQTRFKCEVCACRCPGAGKWVEGDADSRLAYATRTAQRHGQLLSMGWQGGAGQAVPVMTGIPGQDAVARGKQRELKRLPADLRKEIQELLGGGTDNLGPIPPAPADPQAQSQQDEHQQYASVLPARSTDPTRTQPPLPDLPEEVTSLAREVFETPAGQAAVDALASYLQRQRVTSLQDLQWLQLEWLCHALEPQGLTPLLLNKFLSLARQRMGEPS